MRTRSSWAASHDADLAEARAQQRLELRREIDFRHEQQDLGAGIGPQPILDRAQVDLGLAAARDAEQQVHTEGSRGDEGFDRLLLLGIEAPLRYAGRGRNVVPGATQASQRMREARSGLRSQHRGQGRHRDLAPAVLVVVGREEREIKPVAIEGRDAVEDSHHILQATGIDAGAVIDCDDQPCLQAPADRNDAHLPRQCGRASHRVVQRLADRDIDDDAGVAGREGRRHGQERREGMKLRT
jgi:hypothetical protein